MISFDYALVPIRLLYYSTKEKFPKIRKMYLKKNGVAPIELTKYSISSVDCSGIRRISEDNINDNKKIEKCCNYASNIYKGNDIHYISWIFGIILSCLYISTLTIIPLHNTLREPQYYWELMLYMAFGFCSIFSSHIVLTTFFVANMNPGRNWLAVIVITVIGTILNIITTLLYHFIWVNVLELHAPMPMGLYIPGSLTVIGGIGLSWFRYYRIFVYIFHS